MSKASSQVVSKTAIPTITMVVVGSKLLPCSKNAVHANFAITCALAILRENGNELYSYPVVLRAQGMLCV